MHLLLCVLMANAMLVLFWSVLFCCTFWFCRVWTVAQSCNREKGTEGEEGRGRGGERGGICLVLRFDRFIISVAHLVRFIFVFAFLPPKLLDGVVPGFGRRDGKPAGETVGRAFAPPLPPSQRRLQRDRRPGRY